jgi:hypothetical protein
MDEDDLLGADYAHEQDLRWQLQRARGTKEKDTKEEEWKEQKIMGWCKGIMKLRGSTLEGAGGNQFEANRTQYH